MKRRMISLVAIAALCLSLLPVPAFAEEPNETLSDIIEAVESSVPEEESAHQTAEAPAPAEGTQTDPEEPSPAEPEEAVPSPEPDAVIESEEPPEETQTDAPELLGAPADGTTYTRGEWMHELVALFKLKLTKAEYPDIYFPDIVGTTYFDDIMVATKYGLVSVEAGDDFRPDDPLTREFAAQTVNYKLGILNDKESYSFSDAADVAYPDDAQVAVDQGWFDLADGKFLPEQSVTAAESDKILADAGDLLASRNSTETKSDYEFADWVKVLPDTAEVETVFDRETNAQTLTITGYDGTLAAGDTFVYYYQDFAFVYAVDTVAEQDGIYTVTVTDAPEGAVLKYEYSGTIQPELDAFIPDEEPVTLMTADGGTVTFGEVELMASKSYEKDFSRKITLSNGAEGTLTAKIKNVTITPKIEWTRAAFLLEGDFELSSSIKFDFLDDPAAAELRLGGFDLGPFGYAGVVMNLKAQATIGYLYKAHFSIGAEYEAERGGSTTNNWDASDDCYCFADGELSARLALTAYVSFDKSSADVRLEAGPTMKFGYKVYNSGAPKRCLNTAGYLYAGVSANVTLKTPTGRTLFNKHWSKDFYNASNSPIRFGRHVEDGKEVTSCMRANDPGEVHGNYGTNKYATPSNSRYYANASANGSSMGYGGYGSEPVVIWTTSDNDDGTVTITGYKGNASILNIPETIDGKTVTVIGEKAFQKNKTIQMVMMPDAIIGIEDSAFESCTNLQSVKLSEKITEIENRAFMDCSSLTSIALPDSLEILGGNAFRSCTSLEKAYIPSSISGIGYDNDYSIGGYHPFARCSKLDNITFADDISFILIFLFQDCTGLTHIEIPDSVTEIGGSAFEGCTNLQSVKLSENITMIGNRAFMNCSSLTSIELPDSLEMLGGNAFRSCTSLEKAYIPSSISGIGYDDDYRIGGYHPFAYCSKLDNITFADDISFVLFFLFQDCTGLTHIEIPDSVTTIGGYAFDGCINLQSVTLMNGLLNIGNYAFWGCYNLKKINIPDTVTEMGTYVMADCSSLPSIEIPDSVNSMGDYSFARCKSLVDVKLPSHRVNITRGMFQDCIALESITLPDTVQNIQVDAFANCVNLKSFRAPNDLQTIGNNAFRDCTKLTDVDLNDGLETIGSSAFQNCSALEKIILPDTVYSIGEYIFQKNTSLTDVMLSNRLTEIPAYAFANCTKLESLVIPKGVTAIRNNAFYQDTRLKTFTIPATVTSIGSNAFSYATTTTVNGVAGSYAETYAKWKTFNDITKHAESIALASGKDSMTINYNSNTLPSFALDPADSTDLVTLTSDNEKIVSVKEDTVLYGKAKGTANITATTSGGKSFTFPVTVDSVTGIEVGHLPDKTTYNLGERKDRTGLIINNVFSNGDRERIFFSYQLSGFDTKTVGEKTITVTGGKYTAAFPITVEKMTTGKMGAQEELAWTYSSKSDQVTVTGPVSLLEPVLVVSYDENGKMLSVAYVTKPGEAGRTAAQADTIKLFWVDGTTAPKCASVAVAE